MHKIVNEHPDISIVVLLYNVAEAKIQWET